MKRLRHRAAVLLHAGRLRGRETESIGHLLGVEPEKPSHGDARRNRAQGSGQMPAAVMMSRR
jgi:hypothetical protein